MKTLKRKIGTILVGCFVFNAIFSFSLPVQASSENTATVAEYNLKEGGTQRFEIIDAQGEAVKVTITELKKTSRISNGSYNVEFSKPLSWQAGFYVDIKNNQIISAYSPYHSVYIGRIYNNILKKDSNIKASYHFTYQQYSRYYSTGICAVVKNDKLEVSLL